MQSWNREIYIGEHHQDLREEVAAARLRHQAAASRHVRAGAHTGKVVRTGGVLQVWTRYARRSIWWDLRGRVRAGEQS